MTAQRFLYGLLAAAVLTAAMFSFLNLFELKETQEHIGFRGEAKTNNLYAARLFLKRMGIPAERKEGLQALPPTDTVLVIDTQRYTLPQPKIDSLLAWVEKGGHLITRARTHDDAGSLYDNTNGQEKTAPKPKIDPLQTALGITLGERTFPADSDLPLHIQHPNVEYPLAVDPQFFYDLQTTASNAHKQQYQERSWLLELPYGAGKVTVVSNLDFIENAAIDDHDHAELLWHWVHGHHPKPQSVWLIDRDAMPPLWRLLWQQAWAFIITLALAIPLGIWAATPRFGALLPMPAANRRRILEHVHASGIFMWKRHLQGDTQYQAFIDKVEKLYPSTKQHHE